MARKPSKYVERAEYERLNIQHWLYVMALQAHVRDTPDAVDYVRLSDDPDAVYHLWLYASRATHGGLVVVRFRRAGQQDTITACYLDEAYQDYQRQIGASETMTAFAGAYERLTIIRNKLCASQQKEHAS